MAWYDNLQYPDYARHYENQGKIYSDLLNSLSKIGGEYLTQQREGAARKNTPTPEQYTKNYPEIMGKPATPAIPELYSAGNPYADTPEGLMPYMTQRGQGALNAIEGSPARTEFDQTGYINALAKLMTGGNLEERNAAKDAYTVFSMQEQARKDNLPKYVTRSSTENLYKTNPTTGEEELVREGKTKGQWIYNEKTGQALFTDEDKIPSGYISERAFTFQEGEKGKNTRQVVTQEGLNTRQGINIKSREDIAGERRKLQLLITEMNNKTSISNNELGNIQSGINNLRTTLTSTINSLNDDKIEAGKYSNSEAEVAAIEAEINEYKNQLNSLNIDEGMLINKNKPKSGSGGKTSSNPLNINMNPKK